MGDGEAEVRGAADQDISINADLNAPWALARTVRRAPPWDVDRIEHPVDTFFRADTDGTGVDVYHIDSGVRATHDEITGRVTIVYDHFGGGGVDGYGHGTQTAACAIGTTVGLARGAELRVCRMLPDDGVGSTGGFLAGCGAAISDYQGRSALGRPAVANISIVGTDPAMASGVTDMIDAGLICVICAGNHQADLGSINQYPAESDVDGIVVAGSNMADLPYYDYKFSSDYATNYGTRIDLVAPSSYIYTARRTGDSDYVNTSGTSFGTAYTSGVLACMMQGSSRLTTRGEVQTLKASLLSNATTGRLRFDYGYSSGDLPDKLLYLGPGVAPNSPPDAPTATATQLIAGQVRSTLSAFSDPDAGDAESAHQHRIRRTSDSAIIETSAEIAGASNVYDFTGLASGETYEVSGRQRDDSGDAATEWSAWGAWSDPASTTPAEIGPTEIVLDSPTIPPPARVTRAELLALVEPEPPDLEADASILAALATRPQDLEADQVIMAAIVENPVVPATEPCPLEWWDLTVFEDDDVTPILGTADLYGDPVEPSFTTLTEAQGGVRPYLEAPDTGPDESVDPVQCSARVSALTVTVLDKRTDPCDQATGVLTAALPDAGAVSQFIGHRALVRRLTSNLEIFPLLEGVVSAVRLNADKVSFDIYLKDLHERPRRTDLFTNNRSISIFPEGLTDGYGWSEAAQDYLIPAADEATGTFHIELLGSYIQVTGSHASDPISDVMAEVGVPDDEFHFPNLFLRWRQAGLAHELDPWNEIPGEHLLALNRFSFPTTSAFSRAPGGPLDIELGPELGYPTPSDGEDIVFQLLYNGATSEDFPYFWDNGTVGDLYRAVLDGEFSGGPLGVTYDDAAMEDISAATPRVRFIETEVAKDGLEWLTANVNLPFNILPVLDGDKALSPIFGDFPAAGALPFLDISNIEDLAADWAHEDSNAVGQVRFTYIREALAPTTSTVLQRAGPHTHVLVEVTVTETLPLWRLLVTREVVVEEIDAASSTTVKTDPLEIKPVTVRVFGTLDDAGVLRPLTTLADEWPYQLARSRGQDLIDRYKFGAPLVSGARASRSDPYVLAARTGDWFSVDLPWLPNYTTGQRGGEMIGQILSFQDVDYSVRSFGLVILPLASLTALDPPVIDTVALNASGQVEVTLSDLGGGTTARVQIILGPGSGVEPAEDDPHWNTIALLTSTADTATSNVLPGSGEYWVRARSEQSGYRPSAWTAAVEIDGPSTPLLWIVRVEVDDDDGSAVVKWLVADEALAPGIRVYYVVHDVGAEPVFDSSTDYRDSAVDANTPTNIGNIYNGSLQLPGGLVGEGQAITVHVEPWSEYPIGGTMGTAVEAYDIRGGGAVVLSGAWVERTADGACDNTELLTHTVHWSIEASYSGLTVTIERAVDGGAWAAVATGQDASTSLDTSWDDTFPTGIVHDTSEGTEHGYIYRASIVRTSDGAVVSRRISDEVLTSPYVCAEGVAARPDLQPGA